MDKNTDHLIPYPKMIWVNIIFFTITTLLGVVGVPIYIYYNGLALSEIILFFFFTAATGFSITIGYHRLFAHKTFDAHPVIRFLLLFFGAAAFEQSCLKWSSQHRVHHRFVDTDKDPYNIKKGFFYAHIGWLIFWEQAFDFRNSMDLKNDKMVQHQHDYYLFWAITAGVLLPVLLGALTGHMLGAFLIAFCLRLTVVYHGTFLINSACHMFGKSTYDIHASAKDSGFVALFSYGEGYHNFHHKFPGDYRNGVKWYAYDPSKWFIYLMSKIGLTSNLKRVSEFRIIAARLAGENQRVYESLVNKEKRYPKLEKSIELFKEEYQKIKQSLENWEEAAREYQNVLKEGVSRHSESIRKAAFENVQKAQLKYKQIHSQWLELIELQPLDLHKSLVSA